MQALKILALVVYAAVVGESVSGVAAPESADTAQIEAFKRFFSESGRDEIINIDSALGLY